MHLWVVCHGHQKRNLLERQAILKLLHLLLNVLLGWGAHLLFLVGVLPATALSLAVIRSVRF